MIGNPPYNGYSGVAMGEERDLVNAYRRTERAPAPQGQGLNDLYVRFFRMAERKIVEMTGRGVVCFISNYSWLDGLSFTGMRERYLEVFDRVWIDSLNGDKYRTGKLTPEGAPDPSIFSTEYNREGIQVGTAIATLVRTTPHGETDSIRFRNLWGKRKWQELEETAEQDGVSLYDEITPDVGLGLPFRPRQFHSSFLSWPLLTDLFPSSIPGIQTARDEFVIDIDRERLIYRLEQYFDSSIDDVQMQRIAPRAMESTEQFDAKGARAYLCQRGFLRDRVVRYLYRPFDLRWLYWEPETKLLDRERSETLPHLAADNPWLSATRINRKNIFYQPQVTTLPTDYNVIEASVKLFPLYLAAPAQPQTLFDTHGDTAPRPNLSEGAAAYLAELEAEPEHLFHHTIAVLHAPAYREENAGALRQDWSRVPLPQTREALLASAELGRRLAALLNPELQVPGVTGGEVRPELRVIGVVSRVGGGSLHPEAGDLEVTAGWGIAGRGGITMPGKGRTQERAYTPEERAAIEAGAAALGLGPEEALRHLGERCFDVYLNDRAYWRCVPARVWAYTLGGYQVIKKWLSYREKPLLGRALKPEEAREVRDIARRIAAILLLEPALDAGYGAVKEERSSARLLPSEQVVRKAGS